MLRALLLVIAVTPAIGCRTRPLVGDGGSGDGGALDLAVPSDGAPPVDGGACKTHELLFVPMTRLEAADPPGELRFDRAIRVRAGIPLRDGCDVLGDIAVDVMPGNATDFARVSIRVWKGSDPCGAAHETLRIVTIDGMLSNQSLQVHDGAPNGTLQVILHPLAKQTSTCMVHAAGAACVNDCECDASLGFRCVPGATGAMCARSCSEDVDCPTDLPRCRHATPVGPGVGDVCDSDGDGCCANACAFGQSCGGACACAVTKPFISGGACACDADCGAGRLCSSDLTCIVPCSSSAECPNGLEVCGGGKCGPLD